MRATQTPPAAKKYSAATRRMSSPSNELFPPEKLLPGDVLLSCGKEALSILITRLDGGDYSHSAVWDGAFAVDATGDGFRRNTLQHDMKEQWFVDAYRWHSPPPEETDLGDGQYPARPVTDICDRIVDEGAAFAYDELFMAAVVIALSREPAEAWLRIAVRLLLGRVAAWVHEHITTRPGTTAMTCAESVARSFDEAEPNGKYEIDVKEDPRRDFRALVAAVQRTVDTQPTPPSSSYEALRRKYAELVINATQPDTKRDFQQIAARLDRTGVLMAAPEDLPPGSVTPHGLQTSPSLRKLGRLSEAATPPTASQATFWLILALIKDYVIKPKSLSRS